MPHLPKLLLLLAVFHLLPGDPAALAQPTAPTAGAAELLLKCTYRFKYQPDSLNKMSAVSERAVLLISGRTSLYATAKGLQMDSAALKIMANMRLYPGNGISMIGVPVTRFGYRIYKNYDTRVTTTVDNIDINLYQYAEDSRAIFWTITAEKQVVAGYSCQQAVGSYAGRRYEAWFADAIPIPDGPYKFGGLPGLVVKISDSRGFFSFELLALQKLAAPVVLPEKTGKIQPISRADFRQGWAANQANYMAVLGQEGIILSEADKARIRERAKHRNNPIELK